VGTLNLADGRKLGERSWTPEATRVRRFMPHEYWRAFLTTLCIARKAERARN